MKKLLLSFLLLALILPVIGQNQDEFKFSLVPRRVAVPSLTGYLRADGTVTLAANWDAGAFTITANGFTLAANNEPITFSNGVNSHIIKQSAAEGIAGGTDLRIGLDDANQSLIISSRTNIDTDWGQVVHNEHPVLWIYKSASEYVAITPTHTLYHGDYSHITDDVYVFNLQASMTSGDPYTFRLNSGDGLTDTNGRQGWLVVAPTIKQTGTAAYDAMYINVTETSLGDGSTGDGNNLLNLAVAATSKFRVSNLGATTALSYALSGAGTLTSSAGNVGLATSLAAATGNEVAFALNYTTNKLTSGNDTGFRIVMTDTSSPGTSYLQDWYVAASKKASIDLNGDFICNAINAGGTITAGTELTIGSSGIVPYGTNHTLDFSKAYTYYSSANQIAFSFLNTGTTAAITNSTGTFTGISLTPVYNQTGATSSTDCLINRLETGIGTGTHKFVSFGTGGGSYVEKFAIDNTGLVYSTPVSITAGTGTGLTVNSTGNVTRQVYKVTVTYAGFSAAALTADHTIATLPAKTKIVGFYADTTVAFTGGAVSAASLTVGKSAGGVEYIATHDVLSAAIVRGLADADMGTELTRAAAIQGGAVVDWASTTTVSARLTTVDANTNALTAGSVTFYIVTERY